MFYFCNVIVNHCPSSYIRCIVLYLVSLYLACRRLQTGSRKLMFINLSIRERFRNFIMNPGRASSIFKIGVLGRNKRCMSMLFRVSVSRGSTVDVSNTVESLLTDTSKQRTVNVGEYIYLRQEVMFSPLFLCLFVCSFICLLVCLFVRLSVSTISQKVVDRFSRNFVERIHMS